MIGKVAAAGVSLILVVGVVIGVIVGVGHFSHKDGNAANEASHMSTGMKAVTTICAPTDFKDACIRSLTPLANNGTTEPKALVKGAIQVVAEEVQKAVAQAVALANDDKIINNNATLKGALENCKWYLQYAIKDLEDSVSMLAENEIHTINDLSPELKNWLSAVISLKESCLDNLDHPELKNTMMNGLINTTQLTVNALAIVDEIAEILKTFNIPLNFTVASNSRKLLGAAETTTDDEGYPTWFSAADRKLLAVHSNGGVKPNVVVAKDGSGQFKTIGAALAAYPKNNPKKTRYVIYVKAGIYNEWVTVTENMHNVFMYGDGPTKTIVTGRRNNALDGIGTDMTATFSANGPDFVCKSMGFQNTAGPEGHQAVALRVNSDRSAFFNCRIDAYQDTLYAQTHRQFYRNCIISGTIDFIFGDSTTLIQNSRIIVRKPMDNQINAVTAHGRSQARSSTGLVIQNCEIVPERQLFPVRFKIPSYLGRPWKEYSRTIFMENGIGDLIHPDGWYPWKGDFALNTLYYAEYANRGPGANTRRRVKWKGYHVITNRNEALKFTLAAFVRAPRWLKYTGVPFLPGLVH
ncbi:Pectinesterase [Macleaya cordata]|uniref:Pectinesterase n=1 Tax=Macleaya cordata TaxID=56857 RepID=A0A200R1Q0_MACCD|nr:Pectinesterase [Macleaya cordata]